MAEKGGDSKKEKIARKWIPPNAGKGRKKGVQNKTTKAVKEMILAALDKLGGEKYLITQGKENPVAFMSLLGRIVPSEIRVDTRPLFEFVNALPEKPVVLEIEEDISRTNEESNNGLDG